MDVGEFGFEFFAKAIGFAAAASGFFGCGGCGEVAGGFDVDGVGGAVGILELDGLDGAHKGEMACVDFFT